MTHLFIDDFASNNDDSSIKRFKKKKYTLWQRIKLWFHICPYCNSKLMTWTLGVYKCLRCPKTYYG